MITQARKQPASDAFLALESLVRAACFTAGAQSPGPIRTITVSHPKAHLSDEEVAAIAGLVRGLAHDAGLESDSEISGDRVVLRFSSKPGREYRQAPVRSAHKIRPIWLSRFWRGRSNVGQ